jgi:MFS family permease
MSASDTSRQRCPAAGGRLIRGGETGFGPRFVVATSAGSVLNPVNSSIIAVALVAIGHSFGVAAAATTWLVSALCLATAIGQPAMGRLADQLGPRRVYLARLALVAAGGLADWLARPWACWWPRVILGLGTSAA